MKILILGGAGYIGTRLHRDLALIHEVSSIDLQWYGKPVYETLHYDYGHLGSTFLEKFDIVILLAAYASVSLCAAKEPQALHNDVEHFRYIFLELSKVKTKRIKFIYASSGSVYGANRHYETAKESDGQIQAVSFYDLCKRFNDEYALIHQSLVEFYGLRFGTVNGFSPHLRTDIMINAMYYAAKAKASITCSCPEQHRGILDIKDLVNVIDTIILSQEDKRGLYNVCSFNASIGTIAYEVAKTLNCQVKEGTATTPYDFRLNCDKLVQAFPSLRMEGNIQSILRSLKAKPVLTSVRNVS